MSYLARCRAVGLTGLAVMLLAGGGSAQEPGVVTGRLQDAGSGQPIEDAEVELLGLGVRSVTDSLGAFRMEGVAPGVHTLQVRHIQYGVHLHDVDVPETGVALELRLSPRALELEPLEVEVTGRPRTESTPSNVITRRQIESMGGRAHSIGDVVRRFIPAATVTESRGFPCIEFRGASTSRTTGCNYPMIVLDGLPVTEPAHFLRDLNVQDLERIEFVPASEASARYGMGAGYGVLVIETRRSDLAWAPPSEEPSHYPGYEWSREPGGHPTWQAITGATVGSLAGTALGLAAIGCFPGSKGAGASCIVDAGAGTGLAALVLPLAGSVVGARWLGSTPGSQGRWIPNIAISLIPATLGYVAFRQGVTSDFRGERLLGGVLVVLGTPLMATLADHLFRSRR